MISCGVGGGQERSDLLMGGLESKFYLLEIFKLLRSWLCLSVLDSSYRSSPFAYIVVY
jgi:hypothetical protein